MPDLRTRPAEEIFQERERQRLREERARQGYGPQVGEHRGEWFGEMHARWSREEEEKGAADGIGVFQGLQCEFTLDVPRRLRNSSFAHRSDCRPYLVLLRAREMGRGLVVYSKGHAVCCTDGTQRHVHTRTPATELGHAQYPGPTKGPHRGQSHFRCGGLRRARRELTHRTLPGGNAPEYILACLLL